MENSARYYLVTDDGNVIYKANTYEEINKAEDYFNDTYTGCKYAKPIIIDTESEVFRDSDMPTFQDIKEGCNLMYKLVTFRYTLSKNCTPKDYIMMTNPKMASNQKEVPESFIFKEICWFGIGCNVIDVDYIAPYGYTPSELGDALKDSIIRRNNFIKKQFGVQ